MSAAKIDSKTIPTRSATRFCCGVVFVLVRLCTSFFGCLVISLILLHTLTV
jgi:hypothetical protein